MEEVEQICTRIAIMDKGKVIATGTSEELKGMINCGETITVETFRVEDKILEGLRKLPNITYVEYKDNFLVMKASKDKNNCYGLHVWGIFITKRSIGASR